MRSRSRLNTFFRSLRVRLTIWNTLVVLIAVVVALLSVREGLRYYLLFETDAVLNDEAKELLLAIERWHPDREQIIGEMQRKADSHVDRDWHIRWLSEDHTETLWSSPNAPAIPLSRLARTVQGQRVWVSNIHRSVERRLDEKPKLPRYYVRVGATTAFIDNDVNRLTRVLAPVGLGILLLAPIGGYLLSERAIAPLQQIISATERLRPGRLNERLTVRGVGDELDQLATKINQFLDQIADHLRQHRDFVANAAHELRSPLTAVQSSVEVTLERHRTVEEYEELLYSVADECRHLGTLVNQLLQLAESESNEAPRLRQPVRLDEIVGKAVEMFEPVADERGVQLAVVSGDQAVVLGDRQQLRQVVTNLIDNAIKFTPAGGRVTVNLERDRALRTATLTIADTGIGIAPDELPRIFERFYQVDKARARIGAPRGNGLGLSICRAILAAHHGTIDVSSELGRGTTFRISLPTTSPENGG
ncbi:MAG: ATP-binding protein [Planctomycetaceae bacterium]|nr:ATP-binding protein [Planctomycetaceae bacterium]